jgi:hypothetical protein
MPLILSSATGTYGGLTLSKTTSVFGSMGLSQVGQITTSSVFYLVSNNYTSSFGFTTGASITKDMNSSSSLVSVPTQILGDYIYPGPTIPPTSSLQRWSDWQGDIFDGWGFFYLYDVSSSQYYIPTMNPVNQSDGVIITQSYSAFGNRTFTIKHGYPVQGVFKFDISVNDDKEFIFGAYGDMGTDTATQNTNLSSSYSVSGENFTLYYNRNLQTGTSTEIFYTYVIPYETDKNKSIITFTKNNAGPGINSGGLEVYSFYSKNVKNGLLVYFSKTNDVKNWIVNDLKLSSTV